MKNQGFCKNKFIGVLPLENSKMNQFPSCFINNTHKSNQPGEICLAVVIDEDKDIEFFDSYGNGPEKFKLLDFLNSV